MHLTNAVVFIIKLVFILKWWLLSSYEVEHNVKTIQLDIITSHSK